MEIKTFRARNLNEGLDLVREEFGDQVRIMHTREVDEKKFFGLRRIRFVEITATREIQARNNDFSGEQSLEQSFSEREALRHRTVITVPLGSWRCLTPEQLNPSLLQRNLIAKLSECVRFAGPLDLESGSRRVVVLLGSTGVGKTSTIAKIAAHYKLKENKKVALLTMDMFRIAATEQLRKYAEMLELPFETVSEPGRMQTTLKRFAEVDLILLDTPGTNPKNMAKLNMLRASLDAASPDDVQLLLPATHSDAVLLETLRRFGPLGVTTATITKLDESVGLTDLYHFLKTSDLPLRFLTLGQNISEDIEVAGPARLASLARG